jgi:hypothetical protein
VLALDDALASLAKVDPRKGRVVELRFFGGLSVEETAEVLSISPQTVMRHWNMAKVRLLREISTARLPRRWDKCSSRSSTSSKSRVFQRRGTLSVLSPITP